MSAYGRDIPQVMAWTMPQIRLLAHYRAIRERMERKWQLVLASGMMSQEASEMLWAQLEGNEDGEYTGIVSVGTAGTGGSGSTQRSHGVDAKGNVRAPGAPLLSDIAQGKAQAPRLIPITVIDKSKE